MPSVSSDQRKFMCAVESGNANAPGLSKEKAGEFCHTEGKLPKKSDKSEKKADRPKAKTKQKSKRRTSDWEQSDGTMASYS